VAIRITVILFPGFITIGRYGKLLTDRHWYWFTRWRQW